MKPVLVTMMTLMMAGASYGKTICNFATNTPEKKMEFSRNLLLTEVSSARFFLVNQEVSAVSEVQLDQVKSPEQWWAINGKTFVSIAPSKNTFVIAVGQVDLLQKENALVVQSISMGQIADKNLLQSIVPSKKIAISCVHAL